MVTTRSQASRGNFRLHDNPRVVNSRRWRKRYKPTDRNKRHRLPDSQPKTTRVVSYTRRT